jgi:hypothetical protein
VAKLVARLLAMRQLFGFEFESRHLSKYKMDNITKEWPKHSSPPKKEEKIFKANVTSKTKKDVVRKSRKS